MLKPFALFLMLLPIPLLGATSDQLQQANLRLIQQHILPRYQQLAAASQGLHTPIHQLCQQADATSLATAQTAFHQAMDAWQGIQHLRFGPVVLFLRRDRIQLWPDKHNTGNKQLAAVLNAPSAELLQPKRFAQASVAIQGLGSLEQLLFGPDVLAQFDAQQAAGRFRCQLALAMADNLQQMSQEIHQEWTEGDNAYRHKLEQAPAGNELFEGSAEVTALLFNDFYTQLQAIVDQKLLRPLGEGIQQAKPSRAESWRSRRSLHNIRINLLALQELYQIGFAPLLQEQHPALDRQIQQAFLQGLRNVEQVPQPLYDSAASAQLRPALDRLSASCRLLKGLISEQLPPALGISLGFNSLDGD